MDQTPHIAFLPTPGMGHLIPLVELAKRLSHRHGFSATFITYAESASKPQSAFLASLPTSITSLQLPPTDISDLPAGSRIETQICASAARSVPAIAALLRDLKSTRNLVAFVADLFGAETLSAAKHLGVPPYIFFPSNLHLLTLFLHLPALDKLVSCEYRDLPEPLKLPGCVPIPGKDLLDPIQDRSDQAYKCVLEQGKKYRDAEGILVNTFDEIEPDATKVQSGVYNCGPMIRTGSGEKVTDGSGCLAWLDKQPKSSVLFVSFGSGGTLTWRQTEELALGLEASGQRFLWVVRSPSDGNAANYFDAERGKREPLEFLPEGFLERTGGKGFVVSSWAPQIEVLRHEATGGFLTHCGWNSTLESVVCGVPMVAWPLYAEQRMNAVVLTEGVRVAMRAEEGGDGVVGREAVSRVVKELMEGEEGKRVRYRVREMQEAAGRTLGEGGNSCKNLDFLAHKWKGV